MARAAFNVVVRIGEAGSRKSEDIVDMDVGNTKRLVFPLAIIADERVGPGQSRGGNHRRVWETKARKPAHNGGLDRVAGIKAFDGQVLEILKALMDCLYPVMIAHHCGSADCFCQ